MLGFPIVLGETLGDTLVKELAYEVQFYIPVAQHQLGDLIGF